MSQAMKCDNCGRVEQPSLRWWYVQQDGIGAPRGFTWDFCTQSCLVEWLGKR